MNATITFFPTCACVLLTVALALPAQSSASAFKLLSGSVLTAPSNQEEAVRQARREALAQIASGDLLNAGTTLVKSLRNLDPDYPELMDIAGGHFYLIHFLVEYLMNSELANTFREDVLKPRRYDMDAVVDNMLFIAIGTDSARKTEAVRNLQTLLSGDNQHVWIVSLFILSLPQSFQGTPFAYDNASLLMDRYPDLEISRAALRLHVFYQRDKGRASLLRALEETKPVLELHGRRLLGSTPEGAEALKNGETAEPMSDLVLDELDGPIRDIADGDLSVQGVSSLCRVLQAEPNWRVRYAALLLAEPYAFEAPEQVAAALTELASAQTATPDVIRAQGWKTRQAHAAIASGSTDPKMAQQLSSDVKRLLDMNFDDEPFERNIYEEVLKTAMVSGDALAKWNWHAEAAAVYGRLAQKYPSSKVSRLCDQKRAALPTAAQ